MVGRCISYWNSPFSGASCFREGIKIKHTAPPFHLPKSSSNPPAYLFRSNEETPSSCSSCQSGHFNFVRWANQLKKLGIHWCISNNNYTTYLHLIGNISPSHGIFLTCFDERLWEAGSKKSFPSLQRCGATWQFFQRVDALSEKKAKVYHVSSINGILGYLIHLCL